MTSNIRLISYTAGPKYVLFRKEWKILADPNCVLCFLASAAANFFRVSGLGSMLVLCSLSYPKTFQNVILVHNVEKKRKKQEKKKSQ